MQNSMAVIHHPRLQGAVQLEGMTEAELVQHTARLQEVLAEDVASNALNTTMLLGNGTVSPELAAEGSESSREGEGSGIAAPACER